MNRFMELLATWNNFFFSKSLSLFDWTGMIIIIGLVNDSTWNLLWLIPFMFVSGWCTRRFTRD
jgi:hypothetical protein